MKVHVLSDLHLGFHKMDPAPVVGDVLVLAGDITDGYRERLFTIAKSYLRKMRPVLFVPGNHEFYGHDIADELRALWRECRRRGVELLHNRVVTVDQVRFAGTTLWTDFALDGRPEWFAQEVVRWLVDYARIYHRGRLLTPQATLRFHERGLRFLERVFSTAHDGLTVVITHHGVHPKSIHTRFAKHPLNPAFVSNLEDRIKRWRPALWIHGHVHNRFDYQIGETRVVTNPRGYVGFLPLPDGTVIEQREHGEFDPQLVVEV